MYNTVVVLSQIAGLALLTLSGVLTQEDTISPECTGSHDLFSRCLKREYDAAFSTLESEYYRGIKKLKKCFSKTRRGSRCPLTKKKGDPLPNVFMGELMPDCGTCMASAVWMEVNLLRGGEKKLKCVNPRILNNIQLQLNDCTRGVYGYGPAFTFPSIADYDQPSSQQEYQESVVKANELLLILHTRFQECGAKKSKGYEKKYKYTEKCLGKKVKKLPRKSHCKIHKQCIGELSEKCQKEVNDLHKVLCRCSQESRDASLDKIKLIPDKVAAALKTGREEHCRNELVQLLNTDKVNWAEELDDVVACADPGQKNFKISNVLEASCKNIIQEYRHAQKNGGKKQKNKAFSKLNSLVQFLMNFVDSLIDRYDRSCDCTKI